MPSKDAYYNRLLYLLILTTTFRLIYINLINLAPDEAYYWDLSRRLQLSYYDHPPMVMYLISLSVNIFGSTEFAVRLPSVVISAVVTVFMYLLGKELFDERAGFYAALLVNMTLIYSAGGILATIDTPFAMFWLSAVYFGVKAVRTGDGKWWYLKDVALGLGLLSKYTMALFVPAFLIFILLSREHRHWLKRKEPYIGGIVALFIFSPVVIWNAQNDWLSFKFQLAHGLKAKKEAGLSSFIKYLGSQAAILSPFLFFACIWANVKGFIIWLKERDWRYLLLTSLSSFVILFFGYTSLRAKVEGNWPMAAYFTAIVAFVSFHCRGRSPYSSLIPHPSSLLVFITALVFTVFAHLQAVYPIVPVKKDLSDQLHGWKGLGLEVGETLEGLQKNENKRFVIMADTHQLVAELAFYTPGQPRVYEVKGMGRLNQYSMWEGPEPGMDVLLVSGPGKIKDPYIISLFQDTKELKKVEMKRGEKVLRAYPVSVCRGFRRFKPAEH